MVYLPAYSVGCKLAGQADGKLTAFYLLRQLPVRLMAQCRAVVRQRVKILRVLSIEDDEVLGSAVRDQIVADGHSVDWSGGSTMRVTIWVSQAMSSCCST